MQHVFAGSMVWLSEVGHEENNHSFWAKAAVQMIWFKASCWWIISIATKFGSQTSCHLLQHHHHLYFIRQYFEIRSLPLICIIFVISLLPCERSFALCGSVQHMPPASFPPCFFIQSELPEWTLVEDDSRVCFCWTQVSGNLIIIMAYSSPSSSAVRLTSL